VDPIIETLFEILGYELAQQVLRRKSEALAGSQDEPLRQGSGTFPSEVTLNVNQLQGPPCDVVAEMYDDEMFDRLMRGWR
jgi:hypothetical protein